MNNISNDRQKVSAIGDIILNILAIGAGVVANMALPYFKYPFLILAVLLIMYTGVVLLKQKSIGSFFKNNRSFVLFGVYICLIVTVKHIVVYFAQNSEFSLITGYGEVICVLFGVMFFYVASPKMIVLFSISYVVTFTSAFIVFGKNTLYDYGGVCRTIGAYGNPNVLALYACVSLCFSLMLIVYFKKRVRILFCMTAGIAFACILNTTSRAMYLALAVSSILFLFLAFVVNRETIHISSCFKRKNILMVVLFTFTAACFVLLYYPKIENFTVDGTKGEVEKLLAEMDTNGEEPTQSETYRRVLSDENLSEGASIKNNTRFGIWKEYFSHFDEYFLWGNYEGKEAMYFPDYGRDYVPHNAIISVLYKYGILGVILFAMLLFKPVLLIIKERKMNIIQYCLFAGVGALLVFALLHEVTSTVIFWSVVGMLYNYKKLDNIGNDKVCSTE